MSQHPFVERRPLSSAPSTAVPEGEDGRAFFQQRLAMFAGWSFVLGFGFYLINLTLAYRVLGANGSVGRAIGQSPALLHLAAAGWLEAPG
jgi:hypothetical protein